MIVTVNYANAADILSSMGWTIDADFIAHYRDSTSCDINWLSASTMPTAAEIDAAALTVATTLLNLSHAKLVALLSGDGPDHAKIARAIAQLAMSEINILRGLVIGTTTLVFDPANMANGTGVTSGNINVTGAAFGDVVSVAAPYTLSGVVATAYVSSANTVVIRLHNSTGGAVNLASGTWTVVVQRLAAMPARTWPQLRQAAGNIINAGDADT